MSAEGLNATRESLEILALEKEYLNTTKELRRAKGYLQRRNLQEHIDELKFELGWAYLDLGEYNKELVLYQTLSWRTHGEMKCHGIARALTEMGHYGEARRLLEKGLREFPESCALWTGLGILHDILGDHFNALNCFGEAIKFNHDRSSGPFYNKALALMELESYMDAAFIIDRLIEEYPEEPKYLAERGNCALGAGYPHEALQYFGKAMTLFSKSPDTHTGISIYAGLCSAYMELGMKKEGMEIALEGLKKFPDGDPVLYQNAGATFYEMCWRKEAIEILKEGVKKFPDDEELKECLKNIEDDTDDPGDNLKPPILGLFLLMALLYKKGRKK